MFFIFSQMQQPSNRSGIILAINFVLPTKLNSQVFTGF